MLCKERIMIFFSEILITKHIVMGMTWMDLFILKNTFKIIPLRVWDAVILTYGPSTGFCRFDASGIGLCGATVVGGAGVAIGNNVPSWREEILKRIWYSTRMRH